MYVALLGLYVWLNTSRLPNAKFSTAVNAGMGEKCCGTIPMPLAMASAGARKRAALPWRWIVPASGGSMLNAMRMSDVFPAPFSPSNA